MTCLPSQCAFVGIGVHVGVEFSVTRVSSRDNTVSLSPLALSACGSHALLVANNCSRMDYVLAALSENPSLTVPMSSLDLDRDHPLFILKRRIPYMPEASYQIIH